MNEIKLPKVQGETVLYLDFDGVLHHENVRWNPRRGPYAGSPGFLLFEHASLLDELLKPHPQINIVLSTSWVSFYGCYGAAKRLPKGLRERVVGATFHSKMNELTFLMKPRGCQVLEDVQRRRPVDWLALDDNVEGWPKESGNVILTHPELGITEPGVADRIVAGLSRMQAALDASVQRPYSFERMRIASRFQKQLN